MHTNIHVWSYRGKFSLESEMFETKFVDKNHNTRLVFHNFLWDNVEKYCRAGLVTDDNMVQPHNMPDT